MGKIRIVTDSTAYLPSSWFEEYPGMIEVVPLTVLFGKDAMEDGLLGQSQFLKRLKISPQFPTTSQPSHAAFETVFRKLAADGCDIIGLFISPKLSGTMVSAQTAVKNLKLKGIHLLDSESTAAGLALLVRQALVYASQGLDIEEIVHKLEQDIAALRLIFVPDTLEYLIKGGRIGGASALLGTMLKIKPILFLKKEVHVLDKVRTFRKAVQRVLQELPVNYQGTLGIIHIAAHSPALELEQQVLAMAPLAETFILEAGPVLATHAGPGALGLAFFTR